MDFWIELLSGPPEQAFVAFGFAVVIIIGVGIWVKHDDVGFLVFRVDVLVDPVPPPHTSVVPPVVSLYSRGVVISDDGRVNPGVRSPNKVGLRRRRLHLRDLNARLPEALQSATASAPLQTVETDGSRYQHRFAGDVELAALAEQLRDPVWLSRCGIRGDRPYSHQRYMVRLVPVADVAPEEVHRWNGAVSPSQFGHPLDEPIPGSRCGVAAELAGDSWLTLLLNRPGRACFRDPDGTLYSAVGRPFLPYESGCPDLLGGDRL